MNKGNQTKRILQLDVLRAIAILLVLGRHTPVLPKYAGHFQLLAEPWVRMGWSGVELFFVLSGFLIGGLLFQEIKARGSLDIRRFLVRRAFKIWPSYFVYLGFVALFILFVSHEIPARELAGRMLPNLLHLQNYLGSPRTHTWSLAVEEHFYITLPFLLAWLSTGGRLRLIPGVSVALLALVAGLRVLTALQHPEYDADVARYPTHLQMDALFFGVTLAYVYHYCPEKMKAVARHRLLLYAAAAVLLAPVALLEVNKGFLGRTLGHTGLVLGYGSLLVALVHTPIRGLWLAPAQALGWVGVYSYSIYLWHQETARFSMRLLIDTGVLDGGSLTVRWVVIMVLYLALAIFPAVLMARLVEMPALALRDRLFPARSRTLPASVVEGEAAPEEPGSVRELAAVS